MATVSLSEFHHVPHTHCSSTSIQDVLRYDDQEFSEAMIFGLGSGLGFFYFRQEGGNPTCRFNGRADDLEGKFYTLVGSPLEWRGRWDPPWIADTLAAGRPLIAQTDIGYLPHYREGSREPVHFPLHGVVVAELDEAAGTVRIADTFSPDLITVRLKDFESALVGEGSPMMRPYNIAEAPFVELSVTEELLAQAIRIAVEEMLNPNRRELGLPAMHRLANEIQRWHDLPDWKWCARFAYQGIEKRGSGGGGFRPMYADFLGEAGRWIPELRAIGAEQRARESGARWTELAALCKAAAIEGKPAALTDAGQVMAAIARHEEDLLRDMADAVRPLL